MIVGITGSRTITDKKRIEEILTTLLDDLSNIPSAFITGGAHGVDRISTAILKQMGWDVITIQPLHRVVNMNYSPKLYLGRNRQIVDNSDLLIAIWDGKSRGTKYTIDYAKSVGVRVLLHCDLD